MKAMSAMADPEMERGRFSRLRTATVFLASLLAALLVCEIILRLALRGDNLYTTATLGVFAPDPELGWSNKPNFRTSIKWGGRTVVIRTDARGNRIPDSSAPRADAQPTESIVFAGDSYVFGYEVSAEETFVELVGRSSPPRRVVNLGVGGYGLGQSCRRLERFLAEEPDVTRAYLAIYLGNDIEDSVTPPKTLQVDRYGYLRSVSPRPSWLVDAHSFAVHHSRLAFYLGAAWRRIRSSITHDSSASSEPGNRWIYSEASFSPERLREHRRALGHLAEAARARGTPVTVLLIPEKDQVYGKLGDLPNRRLSTMASDLGMPVIDLLPALRAAAQEHRIVWHDTVRGHLSAEGHRVVASALQADLGAGSSQTRRNGNSLIHR